MAENQNNKAQKKEKYLSPHDKVWKKIEECIYRMENGRFMVVVQKRINGKVRTKKKRQVKLLQEARQLRKKFTYELNQEDMRHRDGQLKWKAAYERYLKHIEQKIEDSQSSYKPMGQGSLETAKAAYKYTRHWEKLFLSQISTHHIDTMIRGNEFSVLSYGMKKHYMRHIRTAFKFILGPAASIYLNPAHGIYLPRDKNDEPYQVRWIRPEDMEKVIDLYHDRDMNPLNKWATVFYIGYYTGMRSGELYALKWEDVYLDDPENCYLVVKSTFNWRTEKLTPTKTGQVRNVDITAIQKYFKAHKLRSTEKEYVFPRDSEWQGGKAARAIKQALIDTGYIPDKDHKGKELWPIFHSLRASYIMNLLTAGVPHLVVQSQSGHTDFKSLKSYIAKLKTSETKGVSHKLKPHTKSRKSG
ncbi:MAG: tyrosine-type recombinase/integrase [Bdellovibrionales bacterium]|nr:tyrosine-type recombinase/integrase [Bdellovibrionales bacterium]